MENVIKTLVEMSKAKDEVELDLERVAIRLNNLKVTMQTNLEDANLVEFVDPASFHIC